MLWRLIYRFLCIELNFDQGKVFKVGATFDHSNYLVGVVQCLMRLHSIEMIVAPKHQINPLNLLRQLNVMMHPHMGHRNHKITLVLLTQFMD